jgi:hypothetical protein
MARFPTTSLRKNVPANLQTAYAKRSPAPFVMTIRTKNDYLGRSVEGGVIATAPGSADGMEIEYAGMSGAKITEGVTDNLEIVETKSR